MSYNAAGFLAGLFGDAAPEALPVAVAPVVEPEAGALPPWMGDWADWVLRPDYRGRLAPERIDVPEADRWWARGDWTDLPEAGAWFGASPSRRTPPVASEAAGPSQNTLARSGPQRAFPGL